jgi:YVTN family beta-propeller protein
MRVRASSFSYKIRVLVFVALGWFAGAATSYAQEPATTLLSMRSIALNPATGKFYAAEPTHGTVAVEDPRTHETKHIKTADEPLALAVNSKTNRIYVVNHGSGTLSVIDGASDTVLQTMNVGALPYVAAVNETTNRVYISNVFSDVITVLDGATSDAKKINAGSSDTITIDQTRDKIYLAGYQSTKLNVLDTTPAITGNVKVGYHAWGLAVDDASGTLYVTRSQDAALLIIDEATGATTTVPTGYIPCAVAINPAKHRAYVVNHGSDSVTVVDTKKHKVVATVKVGSAPQGLAVNPATGLVYVANTHSSSISVIDGNSNRVVQTVNTDTTSNLNTKPYNVIVTPSSALDSYLLFVAFEGDPSYGSLQRFAIITQAGQSKIVGK